MPPLKAILKTKLESATRVAVLSIGSELRADDAAGLLAGEEIERLWRATSGRKAALEVFFGHTAPENLTGAIREFKPDCILIIDAADIGRDPGTIEIIDPQTPLDNPPVTHGFPVPLLQRYLMETMQCTVTTIGIQPAKLDFNQPPTDAVRRAAADLAAAIVAVLP